MSYRRLPLCYPRGNFYLLSFRDPTIHGRITKSRFRDCATYESCSKAGICFCAISPISIRTQPTFVNDSVTIQESSAPLKLPTRHCSRAGVQLPLVNFTVLYLIKFNQEIPKTQPNISSRLELHYLQGGISLMAQFIPKDKFQSLPPILSNKLHRSMSSCSKAPRGLSVFPQANGIFTAIAISPGPSLRQSPSRYPIRAGLNLPDKEIRSVLLIFMSP